MKVGVVLFLLGTLLVALGVLAQDRPRLALALEQRLEHELAAGRDRGHGARVLVSSGDYRALADEASALSRSTSDTVLGVSPYAAVVVPSPADARLDANQTWKRAEAVAERSLRNDDLNGAAALLVRAHSMALASKGILPDVPPLPPIFMPDISPLPQLPSRSPIAGLGIVLLVLGAATMCGTVAARRGSGRAAARL